MSCPQKTVHEHAGPCKFLILILWLLYFSVALKSLSMPLPFYFSFFLLISKFLYFLISIHLIRTRNIANFPPPFRFLFLSPLTLKKEVVSCCFCCRFRCCLNKYNLLDHSSCSKICDSNKYNYLRPVILF